MIDLIEAFTWIRSITDVIGRLPCMYILYRQRSASTEHVNLALEHHLTSGAV